MEVLNDFHVKEAKDGRVGGGQSIQIFSQKLTVIFMG